MRSKTDHKIIIRHISYDTFGYASHYAMVIKDISRSKQIKYFIVKDITSYKESEYIISFSNKFERDYLLLLSVNLYWMNYDQGLLHIGYDDNNITVMQEIYKFKQ